MKYFHASDHSHGSISRVFRGDGSRGCEILVKYPPMELGGNTPPTPPHRQVTLEDDEPDVGYPPEHFSFSAHDNPVQSKPKPKPPKPPQPKPARQDNQARASNSAPGSPHGYRRGK